jgi:hypothetical protein
VIERIAGKDYTTLANIQKMRELCRVEARDRAYGVGLPAKVNPPSGSSRTPEGNTPRDALHTRLKLNRQKRLKKH